MADTVTYVINKYTKKPDAIGIAIKGDKGDPGRQGPPGQTGSVADFYFIATANQSVFTLSSNYAGNRMVVVFVGGVGQSRAKGDFTIVNTTLTLNAGVPIGTEVYGQYEVSNV